MRPLLKCGSRFLSAIVAGSLFGIPHARAQVVIYSTDFESVSPRTHAPSFMAILAGIPNSPEIQIRREYRIS